MCSVLSRKSWFEDGAAVEDAQPPDPLLVQQAQSLEEEPQVLSDVRPFQKQIQENAGMKALLEQVQVLSQQCFHENCLEGCSQRGGWKLTMLARDVSKGRDAVLLAFMVYRLKPDQHCLTISKLAVPDVHRRRGYGQKLIDWAVGYGRSIQEMHFIGLSSLATAVNFYKRLGFKAVFNLTAKDGDLIADDEYFPGQVYMQLRIRKGQQQRIRNRKKG